MPSNANILGQLDPGVLSMYLGYTCSPHVSQTTTGIALSTTLHNLGLIRVSPVSGATGNMFGSSVAWAANTVSVAINVTTAPTSVTHSWLALYDMSGTCQAVTADGGVTAWSSGYQTFSWVIPAGDRNLIPGALYYVDVVNNATGTAPKLSGIAALSAEVTGAQAVGNATPYSWATNSAALGTTPPVVGTSTLSYASNTAATAGFFAGLL